MNSERFISLITLPESKERCKKLYYISHIVILLLLSIFLSNPIITNASEAYGPLIPIEEGEENILELTENSPNKTELNTNTASSNQDLKSNKEKAYNITQDIKKYKNEPDNQYRFVSIKAKEANIRKGPDTIYPISFTIQNQYLPVKSHTKRGNWSLIEMRDKRMGWVKTSFLSREQYVITIKTQKLCRLPGITDKSCQPIKTLRERTNLKLIKCGVEWCRVELNKKTRGWLRKNLIWGVEI